ncbi:MAG: hypothetical protein K0S81_3664, partial [Rhodospirillales bacterium]|nr:hypothetical protein [Rhodospirillales bacterium]
MSLGRGPSSAWAYLAYFCGGIVCTVLLFAGAIQFLERFA